MCDAGRGKHSGLRTRTRTFALWKWLGPGTIGSAAHIVDAFQVHAVKAREAHLLAVQRADERRIGVIVERWARVVVVDD